MLMKVASKDLYSILRAELAPGMKAAGFRPLKTGMLAWSKPHREEQLALWFQCDRYGWFADFGSRFTLELQLHPDPAPASGAFRKRERFGPLLSAEDREIVRLMNNRILEGLPEPGPTNPVLMMDEKHREAFRSAYLPEPAPYDRNRDIWLHCAAREQVSAWAAFFRPRMLTLVSSFQDWVAANSPDS